MTRTCCLIGLCLAPALALAGDKPPATVCVDWDVGLELRGEASAKAKVLTQLPTGTLCEQLGGDTHWAHVSCTVGGATVEGWVKPMLGTDNNPTIRSDCLFVQASRLNLRAEPAATAAIVRELSIHTRCEPLSVVQDGWQQVTCDEQKGWTRAEFLSTVEPTPAAALAQAKDARLGPADRLTFAMRAVRLDAGAEAEQLARRLFAELELAAVAAASTAPKKPKLETVIFACSSKEPDLLERCLRDRVERLLDGGGDVETERLTATAPWVYIVSTTACARFTAVVASAPEPTTTRPPELTVSASDLLFSTTLLRRYELPVPFHDDLLHATTNRQTCKELADARRALKGLPRSWVLVLREDGKRTRPQLCGEEYAFVIDDDAVLGLRVSAGLPGYAQKRRLWTARRDGDQVLMTFDVGKDATLTWPAAGAPDLASFTGVDWAPQFRNHADLVPRAKESAVPAVNNCR